ncbi:MAG: T9SS type A sorting domain-containing protein [Calditrichaceae bacterium]
MLIILSGGDDLENGPGLIANNFVTSVNYGVYFNNNTHQNFYHNSVNLTSSSASASALQINNGTNINVINNILANSGGGYAYYVNTPSTIDTSDFNDFHTTGTNVGYWSTDQSTLLDLQTASGKDINSISINPEFVSSTDLHTFVEALDSAGTPLTAVTDDIDGELRDTMYPDIGADEFDSTATVGIEEDPISENNLPKEFKLYSNYPNPFNPATTIKYDLPEAAHVTVEVFNLLGQKVRVLVDQNQAAGRYNYKFDAAGLSSSMYFYRIKAGKFHKVQKMILQR